MIFWLLSGANGRNIAFTCKRLQHTTEQELFEVLGPPEVEPLAQLDGMSLDKSLSTQLIKFVEWVNWVDEDEEDIRLLMLGKAFTTKILCFGEEKNRLLLESKS